MGVDTHISSGAGKRFPFAVGDMLLRLWVTVLLGHAKVNNVDYIGSLRVWPADQEVVRFDVTVDEVFLMDGLDPRELRTVSGLASKEIGIDEPSVLLPSPPSLSKIFDCSDRISLRVMGRVGR